MREMDERGMREMDERHRYRGSKSNKQEAQRDVAWRITVRCEKMDVILVWKQCLDGEHTVEIFPQIVPKCK